MRISLSFRNNYARDCTYCIAIHGFFPSRAVVNCETFRLSSRPSGFRLSADRADAALLLHEIFIVRFTEPENGFDISLPVQ